MSAGKKYVMRILPKVSEEEHARLISEMDARSQRTRGKTGVKFAGRVIPGKEGDGGWAKMVEALVGIGKIHKNDWTVAATSEHIKDFNCPSCDSSSGYAYRATTSKTGAHVITCGHKCKPGDVVRILGLEPEEVWDVPELDVSEVTEEDITGNAPSDEPTRRARITGADQIEPEPVVWAWEEDGAGRIPAGSLSVAAGREGTGKSSFGLWLAAQITRGTLPGNLSGEARNVFYVAVEDSWKHTLVPRLIAAKGDRAKVGKFDIIGDGGEQVEMFLPRDLRLLESEVIRQCAALVVIDPLMSVISDKIDTHRERDVRSALDPLARLADRTGCLILGIAHFNKGSSTDAVSLITGSGAFKSVPRSVFGFARDDADDNGGRVMSQVKNSLGRDDLPSLSYVMETATIETPTGITTTGRFTFTGTSERSVAEILRDSRQDPEDVEDRRDAATWIKAYLDGHGGRVPAKDVIAAGKVEGYSEKTLKNARRKVADTQRSGFNAGAFSTWVARRSRVDPVGPTDQKLGPTGSTEGPTKTEPILCMSGAAIGDHREGQCDCWHDTDQKAAE